MYLYHIIKNLIKNDVLRAVKCEDKEARVNGQLNNRKRPRINKFRGA